MTEVLYKYRSLDNFKNFVDIIMNNRLFAARYDTLNDPMEGNYFYNDGEINESIKAKIYDTKQMIRLCSLAKSPTNFLMWSHYAKGHSGVAIGVRINNNQYNVKEIQYLDDLRHIQNLEAITILSSKIKCWEYEQEVRAFTEDNTQYIHVQIESIHIGSNMSNQDYSLVQKLIEKINPNIEIYRLV